MTTSALPRPGGVPNPARVSTLLRADSPASRSAPPDIVAASPTNDGDGPWMADVVRLVRPRYVLVENVAALVSDAHFADAFGWVLGDLAALGFDARWAVLPAYAVGAPHTRERLFALAYPHGVDGPLRMETRPGRPIQASHRATSTWSHPVDGLLEAARRSRRVADGLSDELEPARVRALGNAVVP